MEQIIITDKKDNWCLSKTTNTRDLLKEKFQDSTEFAEQDGKPFFVLEDQYGNVLYFKYEKNATKHYNKLTI